jgi:hypothetical protein
VWKETTKKGERERGGGVKWREREREGGREGGELVSGGGAVLTTRSTVRSATSSDVASESPSNFSWVQTSQWASETATRASSDANVRTKAGVPPSPSLSLSTIGVAPNDPKPKKTTQSLSLPRIWVERRTGGEERASPIAVDRASSGPTRASPRRPDVSLSAGLPGTAHRRPARSAEPHQGTEG